MQQFIPFEDDWAALENLRPGELIPYRIGLLGKSVQGAAPVPPAAPGAPPARTKPYVAMPAGDFVTVDADGRRS